ncbi:MAG: DUF2339 domain-containing protein [Pseudonocardiaceae bacterium]
MTGTPEPSSALPRLAEALEDVTAQLGAVSAELRALASATPPQAPAQPVPFPSYPQQQPAYPPMGYPQPEAAPPPYQQRHVYQPRPPRPSLSERLGKDGAGSRVLAWVGGAITLIGVVLLLVLAVQRGWIGPVPRVTLGAALAGTLIAVSLRVHRTPTGQSGAFALAATGIAALYLDVVATTTMLELVPAWLGLLLGLLIAAAGLMLAARWNAQPLAIFVLLGVALCSPLITLEFNAMLLAFLLVLQVATTPLQLARNWAAVPLVAGLPPVVAALFAGPYLVSTGSAALPSTGLAVLVSLVSIGVAALSVHRRPADVAPVVLLLSAPAPTLLMAVAVPSRMAAGAAGLLAVPLVLIWFAQRTGWSGVPGRFAVTAGGITALLVFHATAVVLPGDARPIGLLGEAIVLALAAAGWRGRGMVLTGTGFAVVGTLLAMGTVAEPQLILLPPGNGTEPRVLLLAGLAFALIAAAALSLAIAAHRVDGLGGGTGVVWLAAGTATLYGASGVILCLALLPWPNRTGFLLGHAVVTVGWMVAALVLLLRGITRRVPRLCGLVLVGAAVAKLVLFDLASLDGIARVAAFLGAGLVLLAAGSRYARLVNAQPTGNP